MKNTFKRILAGFSGFLIAAAAVMHYTPVYSVAAANPGELLLGIFFNSHEDQSDTVYVSFDGVEFRKISCAFQDRDPRSAKENRIVAEVDYAYPLYDPAIQYHDGYFWAMAGYTDGYKDEGRQYFRPMFAWSPDLIHWSYPNGGLSNPNASNKYITDAKVYPTVTPYGSSGERNATAFDVAAPDFLIDDDGTVWIVAPFGYYDGMHGGALGVDYMSIYLIKANSLKPASSMPVGESQRGLQPLVSYSNAIPVNLPTEPSKNRIDASLYKENGKYYLAVKENGITNEIWSIDDLNKCGDRNAWTLVNADVITGYEGPSLTKYRGNYYMYADKLADYPVDNPDWTTGTFVTGSSSMAGGWSREQRIRTIDVNGNVIPNRHGSVITVTDPDAISVVMNAYYQAGWRYDPAKDKPAALTPNPDRNLKWQPSKIGDYWYENGVRQGTYADPKNVLGDDGVARGREIADPATWDWYWLDTIYNGAKAANKEVWMPYIYQDETTWDEEKIIANARASGDMMQQVIDAIHSNGKRDENGYAVSTWGKWVRYDKYGRMIKGWYTVEGEDAEIYPNQVGNTYFYDYQTGLMAKGTVTIEGVTYHFNEVTGALDQGTRPR